MILAPGHLQDLRASGLSNETIASLHFEAVRPHDIKIQGVESAYSIPYFNLDGSVNCFKRMKLFPPIKTKSGTMRYWQPSNTLPHLYCPPLLSWPAVAENVATTLIVTEGEKKSAAACQHGLVTAGIGGVWCWTSTLDNGDKLALPMLDEFIWLNRPVLICPDSDAWHEEKCWNILAGFFALAKELQQRGASVQFVRLPDLHGVKAGLDDWLLVPGNDAEYGWPKLPRISLDDPRFASLTAWWQKWKEKQTTHDAIKHHDLDDLALTESAGLYIVRSPTHAVTMTFDRLTDQRGGVSAEVTVVLGATELLGGVDLGLKSDTGQTKLASSLKTVAPAIPWKLVLQKACAVVLKRHRRGEPPTHLTKDSPVEHLTYAVNPFVFKKKTTIVYGDGGLGKSTWALFCAMVVSLGGTVVGIGAVKGRALYLDYEDDADVHTRRLHAIQCGHPDLAQATILYQRCVEPLTKLVYPLVRRIHDERITFVVLDSLMASTGGDASAEGTAKLFAALRLLDCEVLALGHVPKTQPEGQDRTTVYGSVFNQIFARSVWELKKEQEVGEDTAILGLFNRKSNLSRLHHPIGLKVTQNDDNTRVVYEPYDLSQAAELAAALPLPNRIRNLLEDGEPRSSKQIAEELGANPNSVKVTLSNHSGKKWHRIGEYHDGKWTVLNR
jgi:hypothetical protein